MSAGNLFLDSADRLFHFENVYPWNDLLPLLYPEEFQGLDEKAFEKKIADKKKIYRNMLEVVGKFLSEKVQPSATAIDREGVIDDAQGVRVCDLMAANMETAKKLGCLATSIPRRYAGLGLPEIINAMIGEMFSQADTSTMIQWSFYAAPAKLILLFGTEEQKMRLIPPLARGDTSSAVAMTEPDAGSDVGKVRATAERDGDFWRITGTKQFISSGLSEMAIVLARSDPESKGLKGLSLFVVPRRVETKEGRIDNYSVGKPETKLGIHGAPTCELSFSSSRAELLGGDGEGFKEILSFMNEARVGVGIQSLGIAQAAYNKAFEYAQTREQMGKPILRHELVADMLLDMEAQVMGMRSMVYTALSQFDLIEALHNQLHSESDPEKKEEIEKKIKRHTTRLRELTPLVKYYCAERCIAISRTAIQIHGGYGVMRDVGVERLLRDSMATAIYEGTSQIQSLMALKDTFKNIFKDPNAFTKKAQNAFRHKVLPGRGVDAAVHDAEWELITSLGAILFQIMGKKVGKDMEKLRGEGPMEIINYIRKGKYMKGLNDFSYGLLHAERVTQILAQWHILQCLQNDADMAERMLKEAQAADNKKAITRAEKAVKDRTRVASRYAVRMLPDIRHQAAIIRGGDRSTLEYIADLEAQAAPPPAETPAAEPAAKAE